MEWCYRAAKSSRVGRVLVATEDRRVSQAVASFGGEAILTSRNCISGTDRVCQAAEHFNTPFIINLQGDQPLIDPRTIRRVFELLKNNPLADMSTAVIPLADPGRVSNPNVVKAALAGNGRALYFSRAPIPYPRNGAPAAHYEHLGIYGFRRKALRSFVRLRPSPLEKTESLEQLRALENGMSIYAAVVCDVAVAIDTPADLRRAKRLLGRMTTKHFQKSSVPGRSALRSRKK